MLDHTHFDIHNVHNKKPALREVQLPAQSSELNCPSMAAIRLFIGNDQSTSHGDSAEG